MRQRNYMFYVYVTLYVNFIFFNCIITCFNSLKFLMGFKHEPDSCMKNNLFSENTSVCHLQIFKEAHCTGRVKRHCIYSELHQYKRNNIISDRIRIRIVFSWVWIGWSQLSCNSDNNRFKAIKKRSNSYTIAWNSNLLFFALPLCWKTTSVIIYLWI